MRISDRPISLEDSTLRTLIAELGSECQNLITLINQLQLSHLSTTQQAEILAELLSATIHLHVHCGEDFQDLIAQEMEKLPDEVDTPHE
jgi:hypothetical protein